MYDPDLHPAALVAHFQAVLDSVQDIERHQTPKGPKFIQPPTVPPTLAGFAAKVGVSRETLWRWAREHPEFNDAVGIAKAIEETVITRMAMLGAYNAGAAALALKNLSGWAEKLEQKGSGPVRMVFTDNPEDLRSRGLIGAGDLVFDMQDLEL